MYALLYTTLWLYVRYTYNCMPRVYHFRTLNILELRFLLLFQSSDEQLKSVKYMFREDSKAFGNLLGVILEKRYPELKKGSENGWITLDILLEWVVWPNYLTIVQQGLLCI